MAAAADVHVAKLPAFNKKDYLSQSDLPWLFVLEGDTLLTHPIDKTTWNITQHSNNR